MSAESGSRVPFAKIGIALAVVASAAAAYFVTVPQDPPVVSELALKPVPQEVALPPEAPAEPAAQAPDTTSVRVALPRLDEVRVERDGLAVLAGRASPFSEVILYANGDEVARAAADAAGSFATVAFLEADGRAQVMTLTEEDAQGVQTASDSEVILAPMVAPPVMAALEVPAAPVTSQAEPRRPDSITPEAAPSVDMPPSRLPAQSDTVPTTAPSVAAPAVTAPQTARVETVPEVPQLAAPTSPAPAPQKLAVLRSDADGVKVIVLPSDPRGAPQIVDQVQLDTISYSQGGQVQLQGRAQAEAGQVLVYLDNAPIATLAVDETGGWRGALPDVDTGVFTLRIDEVDGAGKVISRVETPFKREDPALLLAAAGPTVEPIKAITVQKGHTLWAIARDRYGEGIAYVQVFDANRDRIRDPDLIYPGQVLSLPQK